LERRNRNDIALSRFRIQPKKQPAGPEKKNASIASKASSGTEASGGEKGGGKKTGQKTLVQRHRLEKTLVGRPHVQGNRNQKDRHEGGKRKEKTPKRRIWPSRQLAPESESANKRAQEPEVQKKGEWIWSYEQLGNKNKKKQISRPQKKKRKALLVGKHTSEEGVVGKRKKNRTVGARTKSRTAKKKGSNGAAGAKCKRVKYQI